MGPAERYENIMLDLLKKVKKNLIIENAEDVDILQVHIAGALAYAEKYQHRYDGYYNDNPIPPTTEQAVIMLSSHFYESKDGGTAGFFTNYATAVDNVWKAVNNLLRLDRDWGV